MRTCASTTAAPRRKQNTNTPTPQPLRRGGVTRRRETPQPHQVPAVLVARRGRQPFRVVEAPKVPLGDPRGSGRPPRLYKLYNRQLLSRAPHHVSMPAGSPGPPRPTSLLPFASPSPSHRRLRSLETARSPYKEQVFIVVKCSVGVAPKVEQSRGCQKVSTTRWRAFVCTTGR